jgi:hypothetical protein
MGVALEGTLQRRVVSKCRRHPMMVLVQAAILLGGRVPMVPSFPSILNSACPLLRRHLQSFYP